MDRYLIRYFLAIVDQGNFRGRRRAATSPNPRFPLAWRSSKTL